MELTFYPGKLPVTMNIVSISHTEGYVDDYDNQDSTIRVVLDPSEDVDKVIRDIHDSKDHFLYCSADRFRRSLLLKVNKKKYDIRSD